MSDAITPWVHILAVAAWIGPQLFLFIAAIPAIRTIEDIQVRTRVMRTIVTRFGWMAWGALLVLVLTGISQLFQVANDADLSVGDLVNGDMRFTRIFWEKMSIVAVAVVLTAVHSFIIGPRQLELNEQMNADPAQVKNLRRWSIIISAVVLLLSVLAAYMGAVLAEHEYSFQPK